MNVSHGNMISLNSSANGQSLVIQGFLLLAELFKTSHVTMGNVHVSTVGSKVWLYFQVKQTYSHEIIDWSFLYWSFLQERRIFIGRSYFVTVLLRDMKV